VRCEAISICAADGAAEPASNSRAREAQQQWQLPARAEEQKKQERRANYGILLYSGTAIQEPTRFAKAQNIVCHKEVTNNVLMSEQQPH
jgi:hypothetical protein